LRRKKPKTISTGQTSNEVFLNEIGTPKLHEKHSVGIEKIGKMGRAVVLDQHIIDKLLNKKKITPNQHLVADKYYNLISTSGAFISSPPFERVSISINNRSKPLPRGLVLLTVQRILRTECSPEKENEMWIIMVNNPSEINDEQLDCVRECLDALLERWGISLSRSPVALFQQACVNL
tara:strand:- start:401 stop:934 length:534 start_codon:yes stop_codon:yes gene_type:complete